MVATNLFYLWVCFFYAIFTSLFYFLDSTYITSYSICLFLTDLFRWASCPPSPSMLLQVVKFCSFLWLSSIPFGEGNGNPLQYSCLENPWMEEPGRLQSTGLLGIGHDWATSLSLFTFMHWRRKWQPTPVFLPGESQGWVSLVGCRLGSHRVGHDWSDLAAAAVFHCTYVPYLLYPFTCWWTLRLLPCLGYSK